MKKIISLALVLVMAMCVLTACGTELLAPNGTYSTESGTYKAVFTGYDAKANTGNVTFTFTFAEVETPVSGTFAVAVNDPDDNSFIIDFTPEGGETIANFGVYFANDNAFAQAENLAAWNDSGAGTSYYFAG